MKTAVIYARYSSDRQTEMSIEGQIAECRRYAEENEMLVIREYIDRAYTATTDKRPDFQRMVRDSEKREFDTILVYQMDRFARDVYDSGYYKKILRDAGVRVVSAMEHIADDSAGRMTEVWLEVFAEYFSKQLSEKVSRGMRQNAEKCLYNGGALTWGYRITEDKHYAVDEETAPLIREIFQRVADGETQKSVMDDLNRRGIRTASGGKFAKNSIQNILRNERYIGTYVFGKTKIENGIPAIVDRELYDEVQKQLHRNATARGRGKAKTEEYLLTGKLYCGCCKQPMVGSSGNSGHGSGKYRYYICRHKTGDCQKRPVSKALIEERVVEDCRALLTDKTIEGIVQAIIEVNRQEQEGTEYEAMLKRRDQVDREIERLIDAIAQGIEPERIADKISEKEASLKALDQEIEREKSKQIIIDPEIARRFLMEIREGTYDTEKSRKTLIQTLIHRIYLYDDHYNIFLNSTPDRDAVDEDAIPDIERRLGGGSDSAPDGVPTKECSFNRNSHSFLRGVIQRNSVDLLCDIIKPEKKQTKTLSNQLRIGGLP